MQEILVKIRYFERSLSKTFKKVDFIFSFQASPFNGKSDQCDQNGTSNQSLFRLENKFTKSSLLDIYYLSNFDGVMQSGFRVIPKIAPANLCKPMHIITYSTSICPFESGTCGKEEEKS